MDAVSVYECVLFSIDEFRENSLFDILLELQSFAL